MFNAARPFFCTSGPVNFQRDDTQCHSIVQAQNRTWVASRICKWILIQINQSSRVFEFLSARSIHRIDKYSSWIDLILVVNVMEIKEKRKITSVPAGADIRKRAESSRRPSSLNWTWTERAGFIDQPAWFYFVLPLLSSHIARFFYFFLSLILSDRFAGWPKSSIARIGDAWGMRRYWSENEIKGRKLHSRMHRCIESKQRMAHAGYM